MRLIPARTDSYKLSHWKQYPPQVEHVYSYLESRGGMFPQTPFFGLQYYLLEYLTGQRVTLKEISRMEELTAAHMGPGIFNRDGWMHILEKHGGRLPIRIEAVPEGTRVETNNVLMTVENTDPRVPWLTSYLETLLLKVWYPTTVAALSWHTRCVIADYLEKTGDLAGLEFKLHDFGYRGVSSEESAGLGAAAHLLSFQGTDTLAGIELLNWYYANRSGWSAGVPMPGFSIPAAEHSTVTAWGRQREGDFFKHMLDTFPGLVAVVADTYDVYTAASQIVGGRLREQILSRAPGQGLVFRPDSGDPVEVVCDVLRRLGEAFGTETNDKGYKVLPPQIRVIQGDGVNYHSIQGILNAMKARGWSADNIAFGMGGKLLQGVNRDTQKFAFKASNVVFQNAVAGEPPVSLGIRKEPITDPEKRSKKGLLALMYTGSEFRTVETEDPNRFMGNRLQQVFMNGSIGQPTTLEKIRETIRRPNYVEGIVRATTSRQTEAS